MNTNQVYLLIDLAQTHSFNQTAERHFTTQQSVSYQMKQLEQELKTQIFIRSKSGVEFTKQGEHILQCAYEMERAYRTMLEGVDADQGNVKGIRKIKLCISSVLLSANMTTVIKAFNSKFPSIKLIIKEVSQNQLIDAVLSYECDIAFWSVNKGFFDLYSKECESKNIERSVIREDSAVAVISKDSPLAAQEKLSLGNLTHQPKSVYGMHPVDYFKKNLESFVLYENDNIDIHKQLILEEEVICFTTQMVYDQLFPKEAFVSKPFDYPTLPIEHMILRKGSEEIKEFRALEQIISKIFVSK